MANPFPKYLWRAFVLKPRGMFFPPNFALVGLFAVLGVVNPGLWILGAGVELAYLLAVVSNPRFRAAIDREDLDPADDRELTARIGRLSREAQERYAVLTERCQAVLDAGRDDDHVETVAHRAEALGTLLGLSLSLLERRDALVRLLDSADGDLGERLGDLDARLRTDLPDDLRRSLEGQRAVIAERAAAQATARTRVESIDSELDRIAQQAELLREQTVLDADPNKLGERIDALVGTLNHTRDWLREQRRIDGLVDTAEPAAPRLRAPRARQST